MDELRFAQMIGNAYDIGVVVGETGNKNHPEYEQKKREFKNITIKTVRKETEALMKVEV